MPIITVELFKGRTLKQKREITESITASVSKIAKTPVEDITILFKDVELSDMATGGILWSDKIGE